MAMFTVDYANAGAGTGFTALPAGKYEAVVSAVEVKEFNSGNKGLKVTYTIRTDVNQAGRGRKIFDNMVATEKAMFKFAQVAKAIGVPDGMEFATTEEVLGYFVAEMLHKPVSLTLKVVQYDGKDQNQVTFVDVSDMDDYITPDGSEGAVDIDPDDLPW